MKLELPKDFKLPATPQVARECLVYMYNPSADSKKLAHFLVKDIGISASILKMANSSQFLLESTGPTSDLSAAISRIGNDNLRQIMLLHAMEQSIQFQPSHFFNYNAFYRHGSFVSFLCTEFARVVQPECIADAQLVGLMHDVGLAIMAELIPEEFQKLTLYCLENKVDFNTAENYLMVEEAHAHLSSRILEDWEIPKDVKIAIAHHHEVFRSKKILVLPERVQILVNILCLADSIAHGYGFGFKNYWRSTLIDKNLLKQIGLTVDKVKDIATHCLESVASI